jgi:hypothetical protein
MTGIPGDVIATSSELDVAYPWSWSWVPISEIPLTEHPDITDHNTRSYRGPAPDWALVRRAVCDAVAAVEQTPLTVDALSETYASVTVPYALDPGSRSVVRAWLEGGQPVNWSPSINAIGGGRHRLWATMHLPPATSVPIMVSELGMGSIHEALFDNGDEEYRRGMGIAVATDLRTTQGVLAARPALGEANPVLIGHIQEALNLIDSHRTTPASRG